MKKNKPEPQPVAAPEINREEICRDIYNFYECEQAVEKKLADHYSNWIKRDGKKLHLSLANGREIILEDRDSETDAYTAYTLAGYLDEIQSYLVSVQYYEGGRSLLINRVSGEQMEIAGNHVAISPDLQRAVIWNMDLEAGYSPNGFEIVRIIYHHYFREYAFYPQEWGPVNARWISHTEIEFQKAEWTSDGVDTTGMVRYTESDRGWMQKKMNTL